MLLSYRLPDERESPEAAEWWGRREDEIMPPPNIMAAHGLAPSHSAPEVLSVLRALGVVESGQWTAAAEPVRWRKEPLEWGLDITADPRFAAAVERAIDEMPEGIRAEITRLITVTEADVTEGLIWHEVHQEGLCAEHGTNRVICLPLTRESMKQGLAFVRNRGLDWLFFSNWRLPDGWLSPSERKLAMEIFHDRLAILVRRTVVTRLYPRKTGDGGVRPRFETQSRPPNDDGGDGDG